MGSVNWESDEVLQRFREYLRIPSVHPDIDYDECTVFLKRQAADLDLPVVVYELVARKPVVVITWEGTKPHLPSILLNSHMDVVPVYEEKWSHPPFAAHITEDGWIYARGTQDMKGVGMAYLEAVRSLKNAGVRLKRTVHLSFVPDEEIGGTDGMRVFSESEEFRQLNVGFALDESVSNPESNQLHAFHGEKTSRPVKVTCRGNPEHGSLMSAGTPGEKLHYIIDKFMTFRAQELKKKEAGECLGNVVSINLTKIEGGLQVNIVPNSFSVYFDIRIPPDVDHDNFEKMIENWCEEAGDNVTFEYIVKNPQVKRTEIDGSVPFWTLIQNTVQEMGLTVTSRICPGATDARFIRRQGIPAINLTPFHDTPILLHANDERIHVNTYKKGIEIVKNVLEAVADFE